MSNLRVGLTGGIGSGKSTASGMLAQLGAVVIDADLIAREVVAPHTSGLAALVEAFGPGILQEDESLDRAALAGIVFTDPSQRAKLDAITHPRIAALTQERFAAAPPGSIVVHDLALLTELGLQGGYDHVVVVDCPDELRVERLLDRGLTEADARSRIASQASRQDRLAIADTVLDNSGTLAELELQVNQLWALLQAQAQAQGSAG